MSLELILLIYLIIHILLCIVIYIGIRTRFFKFSEQLMPIIALVPIVGVLAAIIADYNSRFHKAGIKPISLEELHLNFEDLRLQQIEDQQEGDVVVPLEEAMSVNDAQTRRKLMLDILHQNPDAYIELLQKARLDDDIEVTHYASTAMMEMQRDYELSLQKAEKNYLDDPQDAENMEIYLAQLRRYIDSGLIDENILFVYRNKYAQLLEEKIRSFPEDMDAMLQAVDTYLVLENFGSAQNVAAELVHRWPNRQDAWLAQLKVCERMNDGEGIRDVIHQIEARNVYLTPEGKSIVMFWSESKKGDHSDNAGDI